MSPTSPILYAGRADERIVEGRAERSGETYYTVPGCALVSQGTQSLTAANDYFSPWRTQTPIVIDQLACEVTTLGAGNARIGFYRADRDWQPVGAPLADSGDIDVSTTGVKTYTPSTPIIVRPGRYLSVINPSVTTAFRWLKGGPNGISDGMGANPFLGVGQDSRAYAAFPTPGGPWGSEGLANAAGTFHFVVYRLSQP